LIDLSIETAVPIEEEQFGFVAKQTNKQTNNKIGKLVCYLMERDRLRCSLALLYKSFIRKDLSHDVSYPYPLQDATNATRSPTTKTQEVQESIEEQVHNTLPLHALCIKGKSSVGLELL